MKTPRSLSFPILIAFTAIIFTTCTLQVSNHSSPPHIQDLKPVHCVPKPGRLSLHACAGAILRLPINHTIGTFHSDGADDDFKLPVARTYDECEVLVEMRGDSTYQDRGNWLDVGRDAAGMNEECAGGGTPGWYWRYGGAWMETGELGWIRVTLRPVGGLRGVEGGNGLIEVEEV